MDGIKKISENVIRPGRALTITGTAVRDSEAIPNGTIRCDMTNKGLNFKQDLNIWSKFDANEVLLPGSIVTDLLANKCVTNPKIADSAVDTRTLRDDAVTTPKILNLNVTTEKIANSAVTTPKIADLNVTTEKINDLAVIEQKLGNSAVTTIKIMNAAVIESKIADNAVTRPKIMNLAVDNSKIANNTIENAKYANQSIYGAKIKDEGIETVHLQNFCVTTGKLGTGSVTTDKIADRQVTSAKIAIKNIYSEHIADNTILDVNIGDQQVTTRILKDESVTLIKLDPSLREKIQNADKDCVKYNAQDDVYINRGSRSNLVVSGNIEAKGRVFNAVYKDLAEGYEPGEFLEPGDVVEVRDDMKVYRAKGIDNAVVGVVSDEFATCFGADLNELNQGIKVPVGLIGRVHVKVRNAVKRGDKIYVDTDGVATATPKSNSKFIHIGKALETNLNAGLNKVECLIFPN